MSSIEIRYTLLSRSTAWMAVMVGSLASSVGAADPETAPPPAAHLSGQTPAAQTVGGVSETGQAVLDLTLAQDLIAYGRRHRTPEALLTAALMLQRTRTEDVGRPDEPGAADVPDARPQPLELLREARRLRPDDQNLGELLRQAEEVFRLSSALDAGARAGGGSTYIPPPPRSIWFHSGLQVSGSLTLVFPLGEMAVVAVQSTKAPVALVVRNAQGQVVAQNSGVTCAVRFDPAGTIGGRQAGAMSEKFTVTLTNSRREPVHCSVLTNGR